ncbi:hypothetical protein V490_04308 [Pseudogymnoascus sp. VKM F-3557]|nr:hypothetical protein V490_04308 [Pseudogymnoascus sp. VKM F-3557]
MAKARRIIVFKKDHPVRDQNIADFGVDMINELTALVTIHIRIVRGGWCRIAGIIPAAVTPAVVASAIVAPVAVTAVAVAPFRIKPTPSPPVILTKPMDTNQQLPTPTHTRESPVAADLLAETRCLCPASQIYRHRASVDFQSASNAS